MKAVFVDRDGVINRNRRNYVKSWQEFVFLPNAIEALVELTSYGLSIVVLTNQAGVNRGIVERKSIEAIHARMVDALEARGARIDGVLFCPHRPDEGCGCRKPQPGLLYQAASTLGIELSQSYMIGDALTDIQAGQAAGCRTTLVLTGRGWPQFLSPKARGVKGYTVSRDLKHAVRGILVREGLVEPPPLDRLRGRLLRLV